MIIYLVGGGDIKAGDLQEVDKKALSEAQNKKVYVLDLTTNDENKLTQYRDFLTSYFQKIGADDIKFISTSASLENVEKEIKESGLIYIPGGNTELLLQNLKERQVIPILKSFKSIIVGNSAGALVICNKTVLTMDDDITETKVVDGIGLVPFAVDVHYTAAHDPELFELSKGFEIFGIPEKCAIVYDGTYHFIGNIFKFYQGNKEKIN